MAGPRLEVFKFGLYVFMPIGIMTFFGAPYFYEKYVEKDYFEINPIAKNHPEATIEGARRQLLEYREARLRKKYLREQEQNSTSNETSE
ncbi:hypothetical protein BB559_006997 [Furculomyces boomerangus]|uniref:Protein PET100, mitochondrial n=2 Tax=Harpellales TaxID=61421 RepID=A0A2T9XZG9_9FUNG|nr:hypothetical protein BB559_006997 [Furculomyces boomerangus]PWA01225.1 hypothetical protein BB558_002674 [Smittium angustum]